MTIAQRIETMFRREADPHRHECVLPRKLLARRETEDAFDLLANLGHGMCDTDAGLLKRICNQAAQAAEAPNAVEALLA